MRFRLSRAGRGALTVSAALLIGAGGCSASGGEAESSEQSADVAVDAERVIEATDGVAETTADDKSDAVEPATVRSTIVGHADAIDGPSAAEATPKLVRLWTSVGASVPLAECYAELLEDTGLSAGIEDLDDLAAAQAGFTPEQAAAFGACGTGS